MITVFSILFFFALCQLFPKLEFLAWIQQKIPKSTKSTKFSCCYHLFAVSGTNFPRITFFKIINTCAFLPILVATFSNILRDLYVPNPHFTYFYILSVVSKTGPILGLISIRLSDAAHRNIIKKNPPFLKRHPFLMAFLGIYL